MVSAQMAAYISRRENNHRSARRTNAMKAGKKDKKVRSNSGHHVKEIVRGVSLSVRHRINYPFGRRSNGRSV